MRWLTGGRWGWTALMPVVAWATVLHAPAALAFPYRAELGTTTVLSERPLDAHLGRVLARADRLVAASPLAEPGLRRTIVLTDGGWRWRVLALGHGDTFGLRRPLASVLTFNRSDVAADRVWAGARVGRGRPLSAVIAHETTHLLVARHLGEWRAAMLPQWKSEGYADHVAQNSNLTDAEAARWRATGRQPRALIYYDARRRVAAELRANGGSADALLR
jgi:hypothetical protein